MLTFEKVLSVFDPFLAENGIYEIVQTSHGHTILEWDSRSQEWISVKLCATPEEVAETLLDGLTGYVILHCMGRYENKMKFYVGYYFILYRRCRRIEK